MEQAKKDLSPNGWKTPANLKLPLRDGDIDRPDDESLCKIATSSMRRAVRLHRWWTPMYSRFLDQSEASWKDQRDILWITTLMETGIAADLVNIQKLR